MPPTGVMPTVVPVVQRPPHCCHRNRPTDTREGFRTQRLRCLSSTSQPPRRQVSLPRSIVILLPLSPDPSCAFPSLRQHVPHGPQLGEGAEGRWEVPGHRGAGDPRQALPLGPRRGVQLQTSPSWDIWEWNSQLKNTIPTLWEMATFESGFSPNWTKTCRFFTE